MSVTGLGVVIEQDSFKATLAGTRGLSDIVTYYSTSVSHFQKLCSKEEKAHTSFAYPGEVVTT